MGGAKIIWIAPSGGRDRPHPVTKEWYPAPFDASSVDNMRRLAEHAGTPGHVYPLAILCHEIMPPPPQVEKEIGERRVISFHGVGLSVAPSINYHEFTSALEDQEKGGIDVGDSNNPPSFANRKSTNDTHSGWQSISSFTSEVATHTKSHIRGSNPWIHIRKYLLPINA
ncbi:hypothetical protein OROHE_018757 [Orobanche hederae]